MDFSIPQQKAIDIRDTNVVVSASAGSGKTAVLVERLCQLVLKDHISIDSILAMTFTKDAAAEMKARLLSKLKEQPKTEYILQQMALLETASISTIDSSACRLYKIITIRFLFLIRCPNKRHPQPKRASPLTTPTNMRFKI